MTILRRIMVLGFLLIGMLACSSGTSVTELIEERYAELEITNNLDLMYEYEQDSMGSTGACRSKWLDRWYRSDSPFDEIQQAFEEGMQTAGWERWPDDVVDMWRLNTSQGLYSGLIRDQSDRSPAESFEYTLPDEVLDAFSEDVTVIRINIGFMTPKSAKSCFGI